MLGINFYSQLFTHLPFIEWLKLLKFYSRSLWDYFSILLNLKRSLKIIDSQYHQKVNIAVWIFLFYLFWEIINIMLGLKL
jgi:hypothetical protein